MKKFCVIGHPIKHSLSPKLHNAWFRENKIPARYAAVDIPPRKLAGFMKDFRKNYSGANVTIPHKQTMMKYVDVISREAKKIGAVNTVINKKGRLYGYNTDVYGALEALKNARVQLTGKHVAVLGAGGAARAIVYAVKRAGAKVLILNRTVLNAKKLAREFSADGYGELADFNQDSCDLLINTTSVGMWPNKNASPLPEGFAKVKGRRLVVMDIIYRPRITKLLRDAKKAGCTIITGDKMFLGQAKKSFEYFLQVAV